MMNPEQVKSINTGPTGSTYLPRTWSAEELKRKDKEMSLFSKGMKRKEDYENLPQSAKDKINELDRKLAKESTVYHHSTKGSTKRYQENQF